MNPFQIRELFLKNRPIGVRLKEAVEESYPLYPWFFLLHLHDLRLTLVKQESGLELAFWKCFFYVLVEFEESRRHTDCHLDRIVHFKFKILLIHSWAD